MQVVVVEDCGTYDVTSALDDGTSVVQTMYYFKGSPKTGVEWNGDFAQADPFTFGPPWDYIFKAYIDKLGQGLIGKQFIFDVDDPDGNIVKVRDGSNQV